MMQLKKQVLSLFYQFVQHVKVKYEIVLQTIRKDNRGEFTSDAFNSFCSHKGIEHLFTCPYTP